MKRLLIASLLVFSALSAFAQQHPNQERGFVADKIFHFDDIDNVNMFNGNLVVTIPIGPRLPVNGGFSYGLSLIYSGNVWDYNVTFPEGGVESIPNRRSNAGIGWLLSFGRIIDKSDPTNATWNPSDTGSEQYVYESPDGNDHVMYTPPADGDASASYLYSNDGTYIRMDYPDRTIPSMTEVDVELPDGIVQHFEEYIDSNNHTKWRLRTMHDRFGNGFSISYSSNSTYSDIWTITDTWRSTTVYFKSSGAATTYNDQPLLDHIVFPSGATYSFSYAVVAVQPGYGDNIHVNSDGTQQDISMEVLTGVSMPEGVSYQMMRPTSSGSSQPTYDVAGISSGALNALQLPTHGWIEWEWTSVKFPSGSDGWDHHLSNGGSPESYRKFSAGVGRRRFTTYLLDSNNNYISKYADGTTVLPNKSEDWVYRHKLSDYDSCYNSSNGSNVPVFRQMTSMLTPPPAAEDDKDANGKSLYNATVEYFSVDNDGDVCSDRSGMGWTTDEYGKALTRFTTLSGENPPAYLSSETMLLSQYDLDAYDALRNAPQGSLGRSTVLTTSSGSKLLKSTYVRYEHGTGNTFDGLRSQWDQNFRISWDHTVWETDTSCGASPCYSETRRSGFDSFGHYRQESTSSNFPGAANFTTSFTNYSGIPTSTSPWVTNLFSEKCTWNDSSENSTDYTQCPSVNGPHELFCFDSSTGFLNRKRTLRNASGVGGSDVLAAFGKDATGNVTTEKYYGGDADPSVSSDTCSGTLGTATYGLTHTYDAGVRTSSTYDGFTSKVLDLTIDHVTGLPSKSRDSAGFEVQYNYDGLLRVTSAAPTVSSPTPRTGLEIDYNYQIFPGGTGGGEAVATLIDPLAPAPSLGSTTYAFDAWGRMTSKTQPLPDGVVSTVQTVYDEPGRPYMVSEPTTSLYRYTKSSRYDVFGRPQLITGPDGKTTSFDYHSGSVVKDRTITIGSTAVKTTETYDRQGHLLSVVENATNANSDPAVKAAYDYDAAGHLTHVHMGDATGAGTQQDRYFNYDLAGFLISEKHPEEGASGNGYIAYGCYDARGHAGRKASGVGSGSLIGCGAAALNSFDQTLAYDAAERLTSVTDTFANRTLKSFSYSDSNAAYDNFTAGKLVSATRHNYTSTGDVPVTDTYTYSGQEGRISRKETSLSGKVFTEDYQYDAAGSVTGLTYPECTGCGISMPRTIHSTFEDAFLKSVGDSSDAIGSSALSYWPNGVVSTVQHGNGVVDTTQIDTNNMMSRPKSISFSGYGSCPPITTQPQSVTIAKNSSTTLSVGASGATAYQWYQGTSGQGSPISGATNSTYTTPSLTATTSYWVQVTFSGSCNVNSVTATVTVAEGPSITDDPDSATVAQSSSPVLNVVASSPGGLNLSYQWYRGSRSDTSHPVTACTTASCTIANIQTSARYWVRVTDANGSADSNAATLTVRLPYAPTSLVATADSSGTINLTWGPPPNMSVYHYEVYRQDRVGSWRLCTGSLTTTSYSQSGLDPNASYLFQVRATSTLPGGGLNDVSSYSAPDIATIKTYARTVTSGSAILAADFLEARTVAEMPRTLAGLAPYPWSNPDLAAGSSITAADITELREAINQARYTLGLPQFVFTDGDAQAGTTLIKSQNIMELRDAVK